MERSKILELYNEQRSHYEKIFEDIAREEGPFIPEANMMCRFLLNLDKRIREGTLDDKINIWLRRTSEYGIRGDRDDLETARYYSSKELALVAARDCIAEHLSSEFGLNRNNCENAVGDVFMGVPIIVSNHKIYTLYNDDMKNRRTFLVDSMGFDERRRVKDFGKELEKSFKEAGIETYELLVVSNIPSTEEQSKPKLNIAVDAFVNLWYKGASPLRFLFESL